MQQRKRFLILLAAFAAIIAPALLAYWAQNRPVAQAPVPESGQSGGPTSNSAEPASAAVQSEIDCVDRLMAQRVDDQAEWAKCRRVPAPVVGNAATTTAPPPAGNAAR